MIENYFTLCEYKNDSCSCRKLGEVLCPAIANSKGTERAHAMVMKNQARIKQDEKDRRESLRHAARASAYWDEERMPDPTARVRMEIHDYMLTRKLHHRDMSLTPRPMTATEQQLRREEEMGVMWRAFTTPIVQGRKVDRVGIDEEMLWPPEFSPPDESHVVKETALKIMESMKQTLHLEREPPKRKPWLGFIDSEIKKVKR